ncbi:MAG: RluA family pseudouridine synthase [Treponema sp.]|nr:RluA family pseudouridine synthase [Treponema sp.]
MFNPFNSELSRHYCLELLDDIENKTVVLKQISEISIERINQGIMTGALVCWDPRKKERVVLHAVSGIAKQLYTNDSKQTYIKNGIKHVIVPPVASGKKITRALRKNDRKIHELTEKINRLQKSADEEESRNHLIKIRSNLCDESLKKVFSLYKFHCAGKKTISLNKIIKERNALVPTGTGDCCEPKLLNYAFKKKLEIISMAQVFYDDEKKYESFDPCNERCGILFPYLLGLEILYQDSSIVVVNKPSGMLSVCGKKQKDCVEERIKNIFFDCEVEQCAVHRLDMETSGLMILAKTKEAHRSLNLEFMNGLVHKKYIAVLDGILEKTDEKYKTLENGRFELPFRLDVNNRPHQIYDEINGKTGITLWKKDGIVCVTVDDKQKIRGSKIIFTPLTGRTHQLRLASADSHGFNLPIMGDSLYGKCRKNQRLMLHAAELEVYHPVSGQKMIFKKDFIFS